ncbi:hypothetical protein ACL6C3_06235 [Capilliphycus salinus ALCB114379]|uniref:hypothetical protein n=1 Tax=Capilliphycus salinus TaxID=2768948 RepID=UPI0039A41E80
MVMHKQYSKVYPRQNSFKCSLAQKFAIAAGVAVSLGLINKIAPQTNRFEFQQQVGEHQLSGVFEGSDQNANGIIELSELEAFEARWGNYSWTKEDLEVFTWGEKAISQNQGKLYGINGLNFFARGRQDLKSNALQVWNRGLNTPEGEAKNKGIHGIEYAPNSPDKTLFSQELPVEINLTQSPIDVSVLMMLLLVGITGFLVLNPCWFQWNTVEGSPCSNSGKI